MRLFLVTVIITFCFTASAQTKWGTKGRYLTKDSEPFYLNGVNYIVSDGWLINLPKFSQETIKADMAVLYHMQI